MTEEPGYIAAGAARLFRVLHRPAGAARAAVLLLPPCGDEIRAARGATVRLARTLAAAGAAVLRFDWSGAGDSSGESADVSMSSMESDARAAAAELRRTVPEAPPVLLGLRLGGNLALRLGDELSARRVAAVAPVLSGRDWLRQERGRRQLRRSMIRRELAAAGAGSHDPAGGGALPEGAAEDLDGLPLSARFVAEMEALALEVPGPAPDGAERLLVQVSPRPTPLPEMERAAARSGSALRCLRIESFWQPLECPDLGELPALLAGFLLEGTM